MRRNVRRINREVNRGTNSPEDPDAPPTSTRSSGNGEKPKKKKPTNLAELQRYVGAAQEVVKEVAGSEFEALSNHVTLDPGAYVSRRVLSRIVNSLTIMHVGLWPICARQPLKAMLCFETNFVKS